MTRHFVLATFVAASLLAATPAHAQFSKILDSANKAKDAKDKFDAINMSDADERKIGDMSASPYSRASASRGEINRWLAIVSFSAERSTLRKDWLLFNRSHPPSSRPEAPVAMKPRRLITAHPCWAALGSGR